MDRKIAVIGIGCAGSILVEGLSKKNKVIAFEAGIDRRKDGYTYNLAIGAASNTNPEVQYVAKPHADVSPTTSQWLATFSSPIYNKYTPVPIKIVFYDGTFATSNATWSQGVMIGGSSEHIQGVYVNPSEDRCNWWADIVDERFRFENLFPMIIESERFRMHTNPTTLTYDNTLFAPYDGLSEDYATPENRGYNGRVQVMQEASSQFAKTLGIAVYNKYSKLFDEFTLQPNFSGRTTFNSGVNCCATMAPERYLSIYRNRVSTARTFLDESVIQNDTPYVQSPDSTNPNYVVNSGPFHGINGHNIDMRLGAKVQRIVFETKCEMPHGKDYWIPAYNPTKCDFVKPLHAIGLEYVVLATGNTFYVPIDIAICSLGALGTPALLMQSGIGPSYVLKSLGIPILYDQPNLGEHLSNHYGATISWKGNNSFWGGATPVGRSNSNLYLPNPLEGSDPHRRQFQGYTNYNAATDTYTIGLYNLQPMSTGSLRILNSKDTVNKVIDVAVDPCYFTVEADREALCETVRNLANAIHDADPTAVMQMPSEADLLLNNKQLFKNLINANIAASPTGQITQQAHYVGTCGMGNNRKYHCVNKKFILRGTNNVLVCDASSVPLEVDECMDIAYPVQNDGNTTKNVIPFAQVLVKQFDDYDKC